MITVNYGLNLRLKGKRKKRQHKNCQGVQLDLKETQHKKIRAAIRAKHPGWILEGYVIVGAKSGAPTINSALSCPLCEAGLEPKEIK